MIISPHPLPASKISLHFDGNSPSHPAFTKNDILQGKVLKTTSHNEVLLLINGTKITARTQVPLQEGAILFLKVEEATPVPILKLLEPPISGPNPVNSALILASLQENLWKSLLENISQNPALKKDGHLFCKLLNDLSTKLFEQPDPNLLKDFIAKSGLSWEKKLKEICLQKHTTTDSVSKLIPDDLKGLGARLLALNADNEVLLNKLLSTLKNVQLLNHLGLEQDKKIFLPIPMQFPDGLFTVGQLFIQLYQEPKDQGQKKNSARPFYKISFLLELSTIGPLRADLTIKDNVIDGRFLFSEKKGKLLVEKNLPALISNLQHRGFSIHHLTCCVKMPEVVRQSPLKEILQLEGSTVSLMA